MAETRRWEKVNLLMRDELADILNREIELPDGIMVTVTRVVSSHDLYYANVFISVFPQKEEKIITFLNKATPYVQAILNKELKMRPVPRIQFRIDEDEKTRERIEKLLK